MFSTYIQPGERDFGASSGIVHFLKNALLEGRIFENDYDTPQKIICIINEEEIVHEKIQKIPRVSDPKIHLSNSLPFSFSSQFSSSMNDHFSFSSSLICSLLNLYISEMELCYLNRVTFTS